MVKLKRSLRRLRSRARFWVIIILLSGFFVFRKIIMLKFSGVSLQESGISYSEYEATAKDLRDWHDHTAIDSEALRSGLGEHGKAVLVDWTYRGKRSINDDIYYDASEPTNSRQFYDTGYNAVVSDNISMERAVPDVRHESCKERLYPKQLPAVSIIVTSRNEYRSVLLRTLHSLVKRTQAELLHEIILVDDNSDLLYWQPNIELYIDDHFKGKVKILQTEERVGVVGARMLGARQAVSEVLVFVESHVEATHNWLPPLLAPIVADHKTCTTPVIDTIHFSTFEYIGNMPSRGGFNKQLNYVYWPLLPADRGTLPEPHHNPVMAGGLFAINAKYFWHLGAYDEDLRIWGTEQFELSFKIWMCGGRILEVPCSRVAHLYNDPNFRHDYASDDAYLMLAINYKRVAEVWMDEFKQLLYKTVPVLSKILPGDLRARKALRKRLHCKSFKWYLQNIATEFLKAYPMEEPPDFAGGALESVALPNYCLDTFNTPSRHILSELFTCAPDRRRPYFSQIWHYGFRYDIKQQHNCLEVQSGQSNGSLWLWPCHDQGGNQFWHYDRRTQVLMQGDEESPKRCLDVDVATKRVFVNTCRFGQFSMKWRFGYVNDTIMDGISKIKGR